MSFCMYFCFIVLQESVEVLAEDAQSKRGDVLERTGGDTGRYRACGVPESNGPAFQTAG